MAKGDGEGIGLVLARLCFQRKQNAHHMLYLTLFGAAAADDGELDGFWAVLVHRHATLEPGAQHRAAGLADLQGRGGIAREDQLFDGHLVGRVLRYERRDLIEDQTQSLRPGVLTYTYAAARDALAALAIGIDDAVAGVARAGVDTEDAMAKWALGVQGSGLEVNAGGKSARAGATTR